MTDKVFVVGKDTRTGLSMFAVAVFRERPDAEAWAANANAWYGPDHPLTPLVVWTNQPLLEPKPFPVDALNRMREE